ncbi:MAG: prepilin-type N-terminal cleavage/methylation domain-containing protein [Acidobacteriales bacterium]|nr:prepilin-type N-terminal cleavage/methylation domain-containing protein [Terriglobales bacterium]
MRKQKGFSLIELLIVVAIILIIAAIAIPNLLRSRMAANEASAVGSIRTINTGMVTYASTYGTGFAKDLTFLGGTTTCNATTSCLVDAALAAGTKSGYKFTAASVLGGGTASDPYTTYTVLGIPTAPGSTGTRAFCSDESGVIRFNVGGTSCAATDSALQ